MTGPTSKTFSYIGIVIVSFLGGILIGGWDSKHKAFSIICADQGKKFDYYQDMFRKTGNESYLDSAGMTIYTRSVIFKKWR